MQIDLDAVDKKILILLMAQGRMTWADLAARLQLSPPATAERVRRLEERAILRGYSAQVSAEHVGLHLMAFITLTLDHPRYRAEFLDCVQQHEAIQECHHIAGAGDYLLKVRCRHTRDLEHLVSEVLKSLPGVLRTQTTIVLSTAKETAALPLELHDPST